MGSLQLTTTINQCLAFHALLGGEIRLHTLQSTLAILYRT